MTARHLHPGDRLNVRGEQWQVERFLPYTDAAIVEVRGCDRANGGERARFLLPFEPVDRLPRQDTMRVVTPGRWRCAARRALADATPAAPSLRAAIRASLDVIPFQLEPALALLRGEASRFLIADAVGMGKTVQSGLMLAEWLLRHPDHRVLIVTPAGLREQWREELRERFDLNAEILDAAGVARTSARLPAGLNPWAVHRLALTSIDYLKRPEVMRALEPLIWDVVVFDEAHALAGRSERAAAADAVARRARAVVMVTATPHSGDEDAFQRLCAIGRLEGDAPLAVFRRTRADAGVEATRRTVLLRIAPTAAEDAMHRALLDYAQLVWTQNGNQISGGRLAMMVLMRRAASSASSLARSLERRLTLIENAAAEPVVQPALPFADAFDDEAPDSVLAVPGLADRDDERRRLKRVLELARTAATCESKLRALQRLLSRTCEPVIVFTEYRDTLQHVASAVDDSAVRLHGGLTARDRVDVLACFNGGRARLLLATDAASEGLNLHHRCRVVVNLELPWTPLRLEQRIGRVDRIGQPRRVHAIQLVAAGTGEETVLARLLDRVSRMQAALHTLGGLPGEREIAACVLTDSALPHVGSSSPAHARSTLDLEREARVEAARIAEARRLSSAGELPVAEPRAVAARLRSRARRLEPPECYWLFRLLLVDREGRPAIDVAIPMMAVGTRLHGRRRISTRLLLDPRHRSVQRALSMRIGECLAQTCHGEELAGRLWIRREHAIAARLQEAHARLSAPLLQPGLFETRRERTSAPQAELLAQALTASADRLSQLSARQTLHVDACDLVFAVVIE